MATFLFITYIFLWIISLWFVTSILCFNIKSRWLIQVVCFQWCSGTYTIILLGVNIF